MDSYQILQVSGACAAATRSLGRYSAKEAYKHCNKPHWLLWIGGKYIEKDVIVTCFIELLDTFGDTMLTPEGKKDRYVAEVRAFLVEYLETGDTTSEMEDCRRCLDSRCDKTSIVLCAMLETVLFSVWPILMDWIGQELVNCVHDSGDMKSITASEKKLVL